MSADLDRRTHARLGGDRSSIARGTLTPALDANVVMTGCSGPHGFDFFASEDLALAALVWSEMLSSVLEAVPMVSASS